MRSLKIWALLTGIGMFGFCGGCASEIQEAQLEELKETRQTSQEIHEEIETLKERRAELSTKLQSIQHELERARAEYKQVKRITNMERTERDSLDE